MKVNAIRLYKHYCEMAENPKGKDSEERKNVQILAINSKRNMEKHFKTARKYKDDPDIQKLLGAKDGKKPKR
jgi:hypothetical protein